MHHAFLPKSSILDVVVQEVVCAHRVCSIVVFRVLNNRIGGRSSSSEHRDDDDDDIDHSHHHRLDASSRDDNRRRRRKYDIGELMRNGRVSIIPAFDRTSDELRDALTYETCLMIRDELMGLLSLDVE